MRVYITGVAGFIGFHVTRRFLQAGRRVCGIDNLNDYYDPELKQARLALLRDFAGFSFEPVDLSAAVELRRSFSSFRPSHVIHLAAQAGVRYSLENPQSYIQSNLVGFANLLECCRQWPVEHLVFASSSSVYGLNTRLPYTASLGADHPISLYAATKKANEAMAHSYSHLFTIPCTGLRFFTVYGPWGRPDMAPFLFTKAILGSEPLPVFNNGNQLRDFTYIDDVVMGVERITSRPASPDPSWDGDAPDPSSSSAPYRLYNIGNNTPVPLMDFIRTLERILGRTARLRFLAGQPGDVPATCADIAPLALLTGFAPSTSLHEGLQAFVRWYLDYYNLA